MNKKNIYLSNKQNIKNYIILNNIKKILFLKYFINKMNQKYIFNS